MMRWFDYAAILTGILLALVAERDATVSLRASLVVFLCQVQGEGWIPTFDLAKIFGVPVYAALRKLHRCGVIERKETPGGQERGGADVVWYRWKLDEMLGGDLDKKGGG